MADVSIVENALSIKMKMLRGALALKNEMQVPLTSVLGVSVENAVLSEAPTAGGKVNGTNVPGFYFGGDFREDHGKVFWDVRRGERALVIQLADNKYNSLVIGVNKPEELAKQITSAINRQG